MPVAVTSSGPLLMQLLVQIKSRDRSRGPPAADYGPMDFSGFYRVHQ